MSGEAVYKDLINFLSSERADLRLAASEAVLGVKDRGAMEELIKYGVIAPLCKLASRSNETSGTNALASLVYLSSHGSSIHQCIEDTLDCGGVSRMTEIALSTPPSDLAAGGNGSNNDGGNGNGNGSNNVSVETWRKRVNFALALLANMTRTERGAIDLCGKAMPDEAIPSKHVEKVDGDTQTETGVDNDGEAVALPSKPTMALLLSRFLSQVYIKKQDDDNNSKDIDVVEDDEDDGKKKTVDEISSQSNDPYQHFAAVLMNATQIEQGRRFVMKLIHNNDATDTNLNAKTSSVLQRILPELRSTNPVRRRGVAGTIKNCFFEKEAAWWLINEVDIIPCILYPLAGPEELDMDEKRGMDPDLWLEGPDKVREPDEVTKLLLVEGILLLCATGKRARESLRLQKAYVIIKLLDMVEESEEVSDRVNECVQYLRRDEEGTAEGSSDQLVEDAYRPKTMDGKYLALPAPSAAEQIGAKKDEDYDDVD